MPEQLYRYRLNAEKCFELAQTFKDPDAKRTMFQMADAWLMLAVQRAKHLETAAGNEPPLPHVNAAQPDDSTQC